MSSEAAEIDSVIEIVTPENIAFQYRVAGPFRRLPAFVLDILLRIAIYIGASFLFGLLLLFIGRWLPGFGLLLGGLWQTFQMIAWFVMSWFYGGLFETYWNGQTPGKRVLGLRTLTTAGRPINGLQAVLRNLFRAADMMPLLSLEMFEPTFIGDLMEATTGSRSVPAYVVPTFLLGLLTMTLTRRYQRLGDLVSGTVVVIEEKHWLTGVAKLDDPRAPSLAAYIPVDFAVSKSLARTLAMYVDRRRFFSEPRRREVAKHLGEPLVRLFGMPFDTSHDLLLCALYYRTFVADRGDGEQRKADHAAPFAVQAMLPGPAPFAGVAVGASPPPPFPIGAAR